MDRLPTRVNRTDPDYQKRCTHNQELIDSILIRLDGTKQKNRLGANAILSVSIAVKKLSAKFKKIP